jgi:integrase
MKGSIVARLGKNGHKAWRLRVDVGIDELTGKRRQASRTFTGSKGDAEKALRSFITELENGTHVGRSSITVTDLVDRWLSAVAVKVRPNTLDCYRGPVGSYVKPALGAIPAAKLTPERLNRFYSDLLSSTGKRSKRPLSRRTVALTHRVVSMAFDWAMTQQIVARNPAKAASPPRPHRPEIHVPDSDTTSAILGYLQVHSPWAVPIVAFAVRTGMRRGEIVALQWRDVDLESANPSASVRRSIVFLANGGISVGAPKTESGRRNVFLDAPTVELLRSRRREVQRMAAQRGTKVKGTDHVFGDLEGHPIRSSSLSRAFRRAAQAVGSPVTAFHSLRHLHATQLLKIGMHPKIVQERLGHGDITVTLNTYSHVEPGLQAKAADAFNQAFEFALPH